MNRPSSAAFALPELLVSMLVVSGVSLGLLSFSQTAVRLIARNLATNHSHDSARISGLQILKDCHEAASPFRLFDFDGTTYTDITPTATTHQELLSQRFVSTRANGVRFRKLAGGPYRMTANTTPSSTTLTFDFAVGGALPYVPQVGDKLVLPLISREYAITAVPVVPTMANKIGTVQINDTTGIGFTINATTTGNITTACFYRAVAFSVWQGQLRYHQNFTGSNRGVFKPVRDRITSPRPFAVLFPTTGSAEDSLALRISLETYDPDYTNRRFANGTTTLQTIIPPLVVPTPVSGTDSY